MFRAAAVWIESWAPVSRSLRIPVVKLYERGVPNETLFKLIALNVRSPHVLADHHLQLRPSTNVAVLNAMTHVIVTEGMTDRSFIAARCDKQDFARWEKFIKDPKHSTEAMEPITGVPAWAGGPKL